MLGAVKAAHAGIGLGPDDEIEFLPVLATESQEQLESNLSIAIGVPLIVLAVGSALGWSLAGFSGARLK
jgi:hypothetical protein